MDGTTRCPQVHLDMVDVPHASVPHVSGVGAVGVVVVVDDDALVVVLELKG